MFKLMLLVVAAFALATIASAQFIYTVPQTYVPSVYTYPSYPSYPLTYYPSPYTTLLRR